MTQKELIEKIHNELTEAVPLAEITHRMAAAIVAEGVKDGISFLRMLEPACSAFVHTFPDSISDGPWDI